MRLEGLGKLKNPVTVIVHFFETILLNVRRSLSVNVDFRPLFLFAEVIFP
jgi:hypothetical protein